MNSDDVEKLRKAVEGVSLERVNHSFKGIEKAARNTADEMAKAANKQSRVKAK